MELLIGALVIIVLLLVLGVSTGLIVQGILWVMELLLLGMTLFFVVSVVFLLLGKRCDAQFVRIDKTGKLGGHAIYLIDGTERQNCYPAEDMFRSLIYQNRTTRARLWQRGEKYLLFDWYSMIIAALGFPLSVIGAVMLGRFLLLL